MKALYALVLILFSFAAPAQTLEASIAGYHLDDLDCSGETAQQSAVSVQITPTEPTIEKPGQAMRRQADDVVTTGSNDAEIPVGAIQPGDESAIAADSSRNGDRLTDDTRGQSASSTQIIATETAIETLGEAKPAEAKPAEAKPAEAKPAEADGVATTEPNDADDAPVRAVQTNDEGSTAKYSTLSDDKPIVDDTSGQSAMPAQIVATETTIETLGEAKPTEPDNVATTEPNDAEDAPVRAVQSNDESSTAKYSTLSDDKLTADDTSGQSAMPAQIIAAGPTSETVGEAKPSDADDVATTKSNDAEDVPVRAVQPNDESSTAKYSTLSDGKLDDTSGQSAMPAQIIAAGPTSETPGEAKPTEAEPTEAKPTEAKPTEAKPTETDGVATTEPNDAEDIPFRAIQPNDENATVKSDREGRN